MIDVPASPITRIPGWLHDEEEQIIMRYAAWVKEDGQILEIGSEYGRSAGAMRKASKKSVHIHCIDIDPRVVTEWLPTHLRRANLRSNVFFYQHDSLLVDIGKVTGNEKYDLVFVDGNHHYNYALNDIRKTSVLIRLGGYLLIHDVAQETNLTPHPQHIEVANAIETWLNDCPDDSLTVWRKIAMVHSLAVFQHQPRHIEVKHG